MRRETEGALIRRTCAGDGEAFAIFVDRYKDSLVNYLTHLTRSRDRAEELAQDAFVRFYQNASRCRNEERLGPYLYRIGTDLATSQARRDLSWLRLLPRLTAMQPRSGPPADRSLMRDEVQQKGREALRRLPLKFRAALVLFLMYNLPSRAFGVAIGS